MTMRTLMTSSMRKETKSTMTNLVIAEKPSVAQSIAKVLGCTGRQDGYLEGNGYLVSWCVGHLVELAEPETYDSKYEKWKKEDLPIIPDIFKYQVAASTKKQFQILKNLMNRDDVTVVTNACDAGREGELIFRLVYNKAGCKKPMKRLWISSMEDEAIRNGFDNLADGKDYDRLYEELGNDYIIVVKHHPLVATLPPIPEKYRDSFVYDLTRTGDIQELMCAADICISDYSSLVYEYSLLNRPLLFFAYDLDTYCDWRGFYYDYDELAPGPIVESTEEIIDWVKHIDRFDYEKLAAFRYKFMRSCDGHATDRILETIGMEL